MMYGDAGNIINRFKEEIEHVIGKYDTQEFTEFMKYAEPHLKNSLKNIYREKL